MWFRKRRDNLGGPNAVRQMVGVGGARNCSERRKEDLTSWDGLCRLQNCAHKKPGCKSVVEASRIVSGAAVGCGSSVVELSVKLQ